MEKFKEYFDELGLNTSTIARINFIFDFYKETCPEEISDVFITDYLDKNGVRHFESLWFFSANMIMEADLFLSQDDCDLAILKNNIVRWNVSKKGYDFKEVKEESRMKIVVYLKRDMRCTFKASGLNCNKLKEIFLKFFVKISNNET